MSPPPGSREDGEYYESYFFDKQGRPVEYLQLECCDSFTYIPVRKEGDYIDYNDLHYRKRCPVCNKYRPTWSWASWADIEYICFWEG